MSKLSQDDRSLFYDAGHVDGSDITNPGGLHDLALLAYTMASAFITSFQWESQRQCADDFHLSPRDKAEAMSSYAAGYIDAVEQRFPSSFDKQTAPLIWPIQAV